MKTVVITHLMFSVVVKQYLQKTRDFSASLAVLPARGTVLYSAIKAGEKEEEEVIVVLFVFPRNC